MAHRTNESVVSQSSQGLLDAPLSDHGPPLVLGGKVTKPSHYVYVDNLGILGVVRMEVARALDAACEGLNAIWLTTHERELSSASMTMLGVELNAERQSP